MDTGVDFPSLGLSQNARLITLDCARAPALLGDLVAEQFSGREGVNALFTFTLDVLGTGAAFDIGALVGEELRIALLQPDGSRRAWHALCTDAGARGADGGLARYRLRLEPTLAQLQRRRDSHVFQDMDARAIVEDLLADYPAVRCTFDLTRKLAQRPVCTEYRESDFAFLCRLLASEGLNWRFDHAQDENETGHRLVIFDARAPVPAMRGCAMLRFHGVRATDTDDAIDSWHARRCVTANGIALSSWDPVQLIAPSAEQRSSLDAGAVPFMSIYDGSGETIASGPATPGGEPVDHGRLMLQALERDNKVLHCAGAVRRLAPGHSFTLAQHAHYPDGENGFTVLWVEHAARNNLRSGIKGATAKIDGGTYRNTFACVRDTVVLVPSATAAAHPCTVSGTQTALVVGLPGAVATATRDHQVKIQFAWQRGDKPNPGGLHHSSPGSGNAPGDASSGAWVRVAEALAGPNWGSQFTPRIGSEVLVIFVEGNIDRPLIVGQLHNAVAAPPFPAGVDANAGHDGVLSGIATQNFDGNGYNQWQLDDSLEQLRMRLASSAACTELQVGHLVQQPQGSAQRGAARGSGFELRSDAWAVLRGAEGVLLSTSARPALGSGITSTQMDVQEAVALMKGARSLGDALAHAAVQHQALHSAPSAEAEVAFIKYADPAAQGKYPGPVNGQAVAKARHGARELDSGQPVERLGTAAVLLDAAASMNWATPASHLVSAGQQLHWTSQSDLHLAAGTTVASVTGASASLFAHAGGVQAIAANGPVSLQAHTGGLEIIADKEVVAQSVSAVISIQANTKIVLQAGDASITLEGGDITFACAGSFMAKGGKKVFDGGASGAAAAASLPTTLQTALDQPEMTMAAAAKYDEQIVYKDEHGVPMAQLPFQVVNRADAALDLVDASPRDGAVDRISTPNAETLEYALHYTKWKSI